MGVDTINFAIPGTGVQTVAVGSQGLGTLPTITDPVSINGYTQPGASPNTLAKGDNAVLKVELNGAALPLGESGLRIIRPHGSGRWTGTTGSRAASTADPHGAGHTPPLSG